MKKNKLNLMVSRILMEDSSMLIAKTDEIQHYAWKEDEKIIVSEFNELQGMGLFFFEDEIEYLEEYENTGILESYVKIDHSILDEDLFNKYVN